MKNISQILNVLLAAALVILAIKMVNLNKNNETPSQTVDSDVLEVIMTRSSVRAYTDQVVEKEQIDKMLRAAMAAPTARNQQPWTFFVVDDRTLIDDFAETLPYAKMASQASVVIVACGNMDKALPGVAQSYWIQDVSAAVENLLLAAHAQGLGAVWTGVFPIPERVADVTRILSLPENLIPLAVIPIGYPAGEPQVKDKWKPENVHYNKWN